MGSYEFSDASIIELQYRPSKVWAAALVLFARASW